MYLANLFLIKYFFQLLQGGSDQILRSLHLQKSLSSYSYIRVGAQLKVRASSLSCRIKESEGTLNKSLVQPDAFKQMSDSFLLLVFKFSRTEVHYVVGQQLHSTTISVFHHHLMGKKFLSCDLCVFFELLTLFLLTL